MVITRITLMVFVLAVALGGCASKQVSVPPAASDSAPTVSIGALPVKPPNGNAGNLESANVNSSGSEQVVVNADAGMGIQLIVTADSPGGVQSLSATVERGGTKTHGATTTSIPDGSGKVPTQLTIPGVDGLGGIGNIPIEVAVTDPVIVTVGASNFNSQSTTFVAIYAPVSPSRRHVNLTKEIELTRRSTGGLYNGDFPPKDEPASGVVIAVENTASAAALVFLRAGHDAESDCTDANSTEVLYSPVRLTQGQMINVFGSAMPVLPVTLKACEFPVGVGAPDKRKVTIHYKFN